MAYQEELSFVACAFPFHLQAHFQDEYETQTYNPHRFTHQFGFDQGILGHLSTLALPAVVASLAFKGQNLIKILVPSPKIPFTSPTRVDCLHLGLSHGGLTLENVLGILGKVVPNEWMSHLFFREI